MPQLSSILLVDDDTTTNFLNENLIRRAKVTDNILVAEDGRAALALLHKVCVPALATCPALILLDVNMPVMNGFQFLEAYRQLPEARRQAIVIVMLTTTLLAQDLERVQKLPIAGVVSKPLTTEKLQQVLAQYFPASVAS